MHRVTHSWHPVGHLWQSAWDRHGMPSLASALVHFACSLECMLLSSTRGRMASRGCAALFPEPQEVRCRLPPRELVSGPPPWEWLSLGPAQQGINQAKSQAERLR